MVKRLGGRRRWSEGPIDTHPAPYTPHSVHACRLAVYVQIKDKENIRWLFISCGENEEKLIFRPVANGRKKGGKMSPGSVCLTHRVPFAGRVGRAKEPVNGPSRLSQNVSVRHIIYLLPKSPGGEGGTDPEGISYARPPPVETYTSENKFSVRNLTDNFWVGKCLSNYLYIVE